jgi:hypothetical protein
MSFHRLQARGWRSPRGLARASIQCYRFSGGLSMTNSGSSGRAGPPDARKANVQAISAGRGWVEEVRNSCGKNTT